MINPSTLYRILLIVLFIGEILIFSYFYFSKDFVIDGWKSYLMIAILFPFVSIFSIYLIVESFNDYFYQEKTHSDEHSFFEKNKFSHSNFFTQMPFLLKLFMTILIVSICYYIQTICFITIDSVNTLIYFIFSCILVCIILSFCYVIVCMIYNYKINLKKLDLYYYAEQKKIEQDIENKRIAQSCLQTHHKYSIKEIDK